MIDLIINPGDGVRRSKKAATDSAGNALIDEVVNPSRDYKAEYQAEQQSLPAEESTFDVERALANEADLERVRAENERLSGLVSSLKEQMDLTKGYRPNEKARNVLRQAAGVCGSLSRQRNRVCVRRKQKQTTCLFDRSFRWIPAATYSPGPSPAKYHRRIRA